MHSSFNAEWKFQIPHLSSLKAPHTFPQTTSFSLFFSRAALPFNEEKFRGFFFFFPWIDGRHLGVMNFKVIIFFQPCRTMGISFWLTFTALRGSQISHIPMGLQSDQSCAGQRQGLTEKDREQMASTKLSPHQPLSAGKDRRCGKAFAPVAYWSLNRTTTCHQPVGMNLC